MASLRDPPTSLIGIAGRLRELANHAETVADIARTLSKERGDGGSAEALAWAEAVRASVHSHLRDFDELLSWTRLNELDADAGSERRKAPNEQGDPLLAMPSLAELPRSCEAAALFHTGHRDEIPTQRTVHGAEPAAIDALLAALVRSGHAATSLERRLTVLAERAAVSFSRSVIGSPTARSTPTAMISSPPKLG